MRSKGWLAVPVVAALAVIGLSAGEAQASVTTTTVTASADAYVKEAAPTTAEGTADPQNCFVNDDTGTRQRCLMTFTVSGLVAGDSVTAATLLVMDKGNPGTKLVNVSTTSAFTEGTVTWNTQLAQGSVVGSQTTHAFNVDSAFALAPGTIAGNGTYSFELWSPANSYPTGMNFYPRENTAGKPGPRLVLTVDHQPPPAQIALGHFRNHPADASLTWRQRQDAAEARFGAFEGHWRNFKPAGSDGKLVAAELQALTDGKRIFDNWKVTANGATWAQMAAGSRDAAITAAAAQWEAACGSTIADRCWITPWHEPENDTGAAGSGFTAADYRAFLQHFSTVWRASAPHVKIVWTAMGFNLPLSATFWPGAAYVDYIGHDPYIRCGQAPSTLANDMVTASTWFRANLAGGSTKSVVIPEWGTSLGGTPTSDPCGVNGGERDSDTHRAQSIDGITSRLADLRAAGVIELDMFDSGTNYLTETGVDATAYKNLKTATE